jgi:hypothetical protein
MPAPPSWLGCLGTAVVYYLVQVTLYYCTPEIVAETFDLAQCLPLVVLICP